MNQDRSIETAAESVAGPGHLFVLLGKIGNVVADAAVIPTDRLFKVEPQWRHVTGRSPADMYRDWKPADWEATGYSTAPVGEEYWFLDVTDEHDDNDTAQSRVGALLERVAGALTGGKSKSPGRIRPLVLVPVVGVGAGGMDGRTGAVVQQLLTTCAEFVRAHRVDVAIVTPNRSVYGALQQARRRDPASYFPAIAVEVDGTASGQSAALAVAEDLAVKARAQSLSLLIGAGASMPAGLPSWGDLLKELGGTELAQDDMKELGHLDVAQLLQRTKKDLPQQVASVIKRHEVPAPAHLLLSALQCKQAITTNYDSLYESACEAVARAGEAEDKVVAVLPTSYPGPDQRWLLKMHGSVDEPASIVLTRADFAGYDGASRPAGAVLQAVLLTSHLLVVGTSMTDDNVLRLVHEVVQYRNRSKKEDGQDTPLGTVLDVSGSTLRRQLYEGMFRWCALPGATVFERALNLEVFLDCVAMYASDDATWLLDVRFTDLLDEKTSALAEDLRRLVARMPSTGEWAEVRGALQAYGAASDDASA